LDHLFALSLQENLFQEGEVPKPVPPPMIYNHAPIPKFVKQKRDPGALPPTPEAVKRITSDLKEVLHSKNRFLYDLWYSGLITFLDMFHLTKRISRTFRL
jgi:hypothetical protein